MFISFLLFSSLLNLSIAQGGVALQFDGFSNFIGGFHNFDMSHDWTVEMWIKWGAVVTGQSLFSQSDETGLMVFMITQNALHPQQYEMRYGANYNVHRDWMLAKGMLVNFTTANVRIPGNTQHLAVSQHIYGNGTSVLSYFINGTQFAFMNVPTTDFSTWNLAGMKVGCGQEQLNSNKVHTRFFSGQMDEVRIWNISRSAEDISKTMYSNGLTALTNTALVNNISLSGLVGEYSFDDIKVTTYNSSGQLIIETTVVDENGIFNASFGDGIPSFSPIFVKSNFNLVGGPLFVGTVATGLTFDIPSICQSVQEGPVSLQNNSDGTQTIIAGPIIYIYTQERFILTGCSNSSIGQPSVIEGLVVKKLPPVAGVRYALEMFGSGGVISLKQPLPRSFTLEYWIKMKSEVNSCLLAMNYQNGGVNVLYWGTWGRWALYACSAQHTMLEADYNQALNPYHTSVVYNWLGNTTYNVTLYMNCDVMISYINYNMCDLLDDSQNILPMLINAKYTGMKYADYSNAFIADIRLWDHERSQSDICSSLRIRLTGSEHGLHTFLPITANDVANNNGKLENFGYQKTNNGIGSVAVIPGLPNPSPSNYGIRGTWSTGCRGYRNFQWSPNTDCDADLICNGVSCGFTAHVGYTFRYAPFNIDPELNIVQVGSDPRTNVNVPIPIYQPSNVNSRVGGLSDNFYSTRARIQSLPSPTCGTIFSYSGSLVIINQVYRKGDFPFIFYPTSIPCSDNLTYTAEDDSPIGTSYQVSISTALVTINVLTVGPIVTVLSAATLSGYDSIIFIKFNMATNKANNLPLASFLSLSFNGIVNSDPTSYVTEFEWSNDGSQLLLLNVNSSIITVASNISISFKSQTLVGITLAGYYTHWSVDISPIMNGSYSNLLCIASRVWNSLLSTCTTCGIGFVPNDARTACIACSPGYSNPFVEATACTPCSLGFYSNISASQTCSSCPIGSFSANPGSSSCIPCQIGLYQNHVGQAQCKECPIGTFNNQIGQSSCKDCPFDNSITVQGAINSTQCGCAVGFYHNCMNSIMETHPDLTINPDLVESCLSTNSLQLLVNGSRTSSNFCLPCPDYGTVCQGYLTDNLSHIQPVAIPGYSLEIGFPYGSFKCVDNDFNACPGGSPGTCGENRLGSVPACGRCETGFFMTGGSNSFTCDKCTSSSPVSWSVFVIFCLISLYIMHRWTNYMTNITSITDLQLDSIGNSLASSLGITITVLQSISIIGGVSTLSSTSSTGTSSNSSSYSSSDFINSLVNFFSFLTLDFDFLQTSCTFGNSFSFRYLVRTILPLFVFLVILSSYPIKIFLSRIQLLKLNPLHVPNLINFVGVICTSLYITLASNVLLVFECYSSPNGLTNLVTFPDIVCETVERTNMAVVGGFFTVFYVVGIPIWILYSLLKAPKMSEHDQHSITVVYYNCRNRFLFTKYYQAHSYWTIFGLLKSLMFALTATFFPGENQYQSMWISFVLIVYLIPTTYTRPWRSYSNNILDIMTSVGLLLLGILNGLASAGFDGISRQVTGLLILIYIMTPCVIICGYQTKSLLVQIYQEKKREKMDNKFSSITNEENKYSSGHVEGGNISGETDASDIHINAEIA